MTPSAGLQASLLRQHWLQNSRTMLGNRNAVLFIAYMSIIWIIFYQVSGSTAKIFLDSQQYQRLAAEKDVLEAFSTLRPAGAIWLFKLLDNTDVFLFAQFILYTTALAFLLQALKTTLLHNGSFLVACVMCVIFFTHEYFTLWITTALTETVFFSFMLIQFAFLLRFLHNGRLRNMAGIAASALVLVLLRDYGAYYVLLFAGIMALAGFPRRNRQALVGAGLLVCIFLFSSINADRNARWQFPMLNNFGQRILVSSNHLAWFANQGMPVNESLTRKSGLWAHEKDAEGLGFEDDPALEAFRNWLREDGKFVYAKFLLTHPHYAFSPLVTQWNILFYGNFDAIYWYREAGFKRTAISGGTRESFRGFLLLLAGLCLVTAPFVLLKQKRHRADYVMATLFMMMIFPMAFIGYHADTMEIHRHLLPVIFHYGLGILLFMRLIDRMLAERHTERRNHPPAAPVCTGRPFSWTRADSASAASKN